MNVKPKKIESLTVEDLKVFPVWQYVNDDKQGETIVLPVKRLPVDNFNGMVIGTQIRTANRSVFWALIGNVDVRNPELNEHFLTISIERNGQWFTLARYHDIDYDKRGPTALANFMRLDVGQVFPMYYDLRKYAKGTPSILAGKILETPRTKLTDDQIIALAIP